MEQSDDAGTREPIGRQVTRTQERWRALIEAQSVSGLGVEAYCRQHEIISSCIYRWRRFLTGTSGAASPWASKNKKRPPPLGGFASVNVAEDRSGPQTGVPRREPIRLRLTGGRKLVLLAVGMRSEAGPAGRTGE